MVFMLCFSPFGQMIRPFIDSMSVQPTGGHALFEEPPGTQAPTSKPPSTQKQQTAGTSQETARKQTPVIFKQVGNKYLQSTLVISNSKGLSEILRYIHTSTFQICRIEEKIIRTTTFNKYICNWTLEFRDILKILWKSGEIAPAISPLFHNIFLPVVRFSCMGRDQIFTSR